MNRVDHWAEALRLLEEEGRQRLGADSQRLRQLAQIHATLATVPDSISGALDARAVIAERRQQ